MTAHREERSDSLGKQALTRPELKNDVEVLRDSLPDASTKPVVSVLIVSHQCAAELVRCLDALEAERHALPIEVIVVDNASQDETVGAVIRRFPWVRLIANLENVGFARASNQAMSVSTGEYLLLLNPDTEVPPGTITKILRELESRPRVGMLSCKLVRLDGSFDHACKRGFPTVASALYYFVGLSRLMPKSRHFAQYTAGNLDASKPALVDAVSGAFMFVRREAVDDIGVFDERYWLYAEDLDWCRRFWKGGWQVLYWPGAEVLHVKGASAGDRRSWKLNFAFHRSIWLFYAKHHAGHHPKVLSALVWVGIWAKFSLSALAGSLRALATGRQAQDSTGISNRAN